MHTVGILRRQEFVQSDFTYDGEVRVSTRLDFSEFIKGMEFDGATCSLCREQIGFGLAYDAYSDRESTSFSLFMLVQVADMPVVALCDDCAEVIRVVIHDTGLVPE